MIDLLWDGAYLIDGTHWVPDSGQATDDIKKQYGITTDATSAKKGTIASGIINAHNTSKDDSRLKIHFDSLTSHDITYVGIVMTAKASGMERFPIPYVLTNCHNSLCAVGGTINEDDHKFALSAAKKYGGIYVPPNLAVIHSYNRERMAKGGAMILGSDSHTRYGALGTMAVGEGGGELAKQLLGQSYDMATPPVVGVFLKNAPSTAVGPQDVALSLIKAVFDNGFAKNAVLEFIGDGVDGLSAEFRNAVDVMTTETTCWSSIWKTDQVIEEYLTIHGRKGDYQSLQPERIAYYDRFIVLDLVKVKPSIALPYHPSNVYTIEELLDNPEDIFREVERASEAIFEANDIKIDLLSKIRDGKIHVDQGLVVGCSGGNFDSIMDAADILEGGSIGNGAFSMSVYAGSQPIYMELIKNGGAQKLMEAGVTMKSAFCGPCFGAGDTPGNGELSIRHATRNFPNRDGSKPNEGQYTMIALMDAKSIAATAANGGVLTPAPEVEKAKHYPYHYDASIYDKRVYDGVGRAEPEIELSYGPNIKDWPTIPALSEDLFLKVVSVINDPVTTTDELIPSGETSAYRSNPLRLAEFTLSRKDPAYVGEAKKVAAIDKARGEGTIDPSLNDAYEKLYNTLGIDAAILKRANVASTIFAVKPGDGSAREQAASCQRVLGAGANISREYATKRYRSNLINWGMVPFLLNPDVTVNLGEYLFIPNVKHGLKEGWTSFEAYLIGDFVKSVVLTVDPLDEKEREILLAGSLINYNKAKLVK